MGKQDYGLIQFNENGFYCPKGDFYIDPKKPVKNAFITHSHSDHINNYCTNYFTSSENLELLRTRSRKKINIKDYKFREIFEFNGVKISFFPAGHIIGSAQIKIEYEDDSWVFTGDYKIHNDGISTPYEQLKGSNFVTESTFALPIFQWEEQKTVIEEINDWWRENKRRKINSILFCYSLGKAQRIIKNIDHSIGKVFVNKSIQEINNTINKIEGFKIEKCFNFDEYKNGIDKGSLFLLSGTYREIEKYSIDKPFSLAKASGWMIFKNSLKKYGLHRGFVLSDHCDWNELNIAVRNSGAKRVFTTHGFTKNFTKHLRMQGIESYEII